MRRRGARRWGRAGLMLVGAVGLLAVVPFSRLSRAPRVQGIAQGAGGRQLQAGAATADIAFPLPVETVGYGLVRPEVHRAVQPPSARAVVLASDDVRVGLVTLDLLLADAGLVDAVREAAARLGLSMLWVTATHTHSSAGGFAWNPVIQVAGTGRVRPDVRAPIVEAAARALANAAGALRPVQALAGASELAGATMSRDEFPEVDRRLTRIELRADAGPVAQLVVLAAHPTLVARPPPGLDPDWPGRLARAEEQGGRGVTLVLQGNVGNVTVQRAGVSEDEPAEAFAQVVSVALRSVPLQPLGPGLSYSRVEVTLPGPDASRLVPWGTATLVDNVALWPWAPGWAEVALLRIGALRLLGVPVETTAASGRLLEGAAGGARVVSLANGYLGYVEPADRVVRGEGESRRQLFGPELLESLRFGTEATRAALRPSSETTDSTR